MRTDWTVADFDGLSSSQVAEINASNQRYNDLAESIEEMNMEIAMRQIDDGTYDAPVKKSKKRKSKKQVQRSFLKIVLKMFLLTLWKMVSTSINNPVQPTFYSITNNLGSTYENNQSSLHSSQVRSIH